MNRLGLPVALTLAVGATGCLSTNPYSSARTLDKGDIGHTVGLSGFVYKDDNGDTAPGVPAPSYGFRAGVAKGLDLGAQYMGPTGFRLDAKYNPLRTRWFDLAISPSVWLGYFPTDNSRDEGAFTMTVDAALIADVNLHEQFSLVIWSGPGYLWVPRLGAGGTIVRSGAGFQIRLPRVTIQPEVSSVLDPSRWDFVDIAFGLGFSFGDRPTFEG